MTSCFSDTLGKEFHKTASYVSEFDPLYVEFTEGAIRLACKLRL